MLCSKEGYHALVDLRKGQLGHLNNFGSWERPSQLDSLIDE